MRFLHADLCPALSIALEGLQSWVLKEAAQASGWKKSIWLFGGTSEGGGGEDLFFLPISLQFRLRQESFIGKLLIANMKLCDTAPYAVNVVISGLY